MRILIIGRTPLETVDGIQRVTFNFIKSAQNKGHYVCLAIPEGKNKESDDLKKFNIVRVKNDKKSSGILSHFLRHFIGFDYFYFNTEFYKQLISNEKPDIIVVIGYRLVPEVKKTLKNLGKDDIKVVSWIHNNIVHKDKEVVKSTLRNFLSKGIKSRTLKKADAHLAISTGTKNQILSFAPSAKVYTVFNPLDSYNGKLIKRSQMPVFLYVGRIEDWQKNLSFMFNGLSKIKKDWKLIIVGKGSDEEKLKSLANDLGISQRIEWRGFKKDPYENLDDGVTALLLTSRFEGFPMVLIEANQRGIPVIASDCKVGPSDIVISGVNGYLYPEEDMIAFVKIVNDVIDGKLKFETPEKIEETAKRFSGDVVLDNIINALKELTNSK